MTVTINGTTGIAGVDGSAATPAVQGADTNTGVFYGTDIVGISTGGTERMRINASGQAEFAAGTVALPAISTTGDTNTGIFFPAADTIAFAKGGAEAMRIASSGQIGIGGANYGTSGQVLTSGGSAAAPSWATPSWVLIQTQTASASSTIDFTGLSGYSRLRLSGHNITVSSVTSDHYLRVSSDNGATFLATSTYNNRNAFPTSATATGYQESLLDANFVLMQISAGTRTGMAYEFNITNFNFAQPTQLFGWSGKNSATATQRYFTSDQTGSTAWNAIRLLQSTGTITTGTFILEGIVG